ncbi:MAG: Mth938-like domain-containing protein [Elusimicrobiota bacterium]
MKINSYEFGRMIVNDKLYNSDVIIFPNRIKENWWRKKGHQLCIEDLEEVIKFDPELVVVGTGDSGAMRVLSETVKFLEEKGIMLEAMPTGEAVDKFNQEFSAGKKVVGCFHLTC